MKNLDLSSKSEFLERLHRQLRKGIRRADPLLIADSNLTPEGAVSSYGKMLLDRSAMPQEPLYFY